MMHRLECDGTDGCDCECWCHARCGAQMPNAAQPCYRRRNHKSEHRSRYAIENARKRAA